MSTTEQPSSYIVVFKDSATPEQIDQYVSQINKSGGKVNHQYKEVMKGFSAELKPEHLQNFQADDIIDYVEPDQVVTIQPTINRT